VVVAVGEDGCRDLYFVAEDALCGVAPAFDLGLNFFDHYATAALGGFHANCFSWINCWFDFCSGDKDFR